MIEYYIIAHYYDGRRASKIANYSSRFSALKDIQNVYVPNGNCWFGLAVSFDGEEPMELPEF